MHRPDVLHAPIVVVVIGTTTWLMISDCCWELMMKMSCCCWWNNWEWLQIINIVVIMSCSLVWWGRWRISVHGFSHVGDLASAYCLCVVKVINIIHLIWISSSTSCSLVVVEAAALRRIMISLLNVFLNPSPPEVLNLIVSSSRKVLCNFGPPGGGKI